MIRTNGESTRTRLDALTGIRGPAAIAIVLFHEISNYTGARANAAGSYFANGKSLLLHGVHDLSLAGPSLVTLFFVLSGFVLTYVYGESISQKQFNFRKFIIARLSRLYPVYLLSLGVALPLIVEGLRKGALGSTFVLVKAPLCLTLMQSWLPMAAYAWNVPAWAISVELFLYLLFPVLARMVSGSRPRLLLWMTACVLLSVMISAILRPLVMTDVVPGTQRLQFGLAFVTCFPLLRLPEFVIGIALARYFSMRDRRYDSAISICGVVSFVMIVSSFFVIPNVAVLQRLTGLMLAFYAILILSCSVDGPVTRLFSSRPLLLLGEASFAIYILHVPLAQILARITDRFTHHKETYLGFDNPAWFAAYFVVMLAVSIAVLFYFEIPARNWLKARLESWTTRSSLQKAPMDAVSIGS